MKLNKILSSAVAIFLAVGLIAGCDSTGTDGFAGSNSVKLQFKTVSPSSSGTSFQHGGSGLADDSLIIEGSNGTLQINDIGFIVEEFELEPADAEEDENDTTETEEEDLEEFESGPFFIDLPLEEDSLSLGSAEIRAGLYEELEFEVKDLDFDDFEEDEEDAEHRALADSIRTHFPDWPDEASMVLTGVFTPADGDARQFKVYAEAEIEIEMEFNPPLEVTEDNAERVVTVNINPALWLVRADGTVIDLSQFNWDDHQQLLEFSAEFENGMTEIEVDEFDEGDE